MPPPVLWIRHGESEANAGLPTPDVWSTPLTEEGHRQAELIAASLGAGGRPPSLIVRSCMFRAGQTAEPACARFPDTRVEEWPVHEFTFLSGAAYAHTTQDQRDEGVRGYWERMDPWWCDGPGAESFAAFIGRVDETLGRLRAAVAQSRGPIVIFSHGRFMRGVVLRVGEFLGAGGCGGMRCAVAAPDEPLEVQMRRAMQMLHAVSVPNGVIWPMVMVGERWAMAAPQVGHLLAAEHEEP